MKPSQPDITGWIPVALLIGLLAVLYPGSVAGQPAEQPPANGVATEQPSGAKREQARQQFKQGELHYRMGKFRLAIEAYRRALELDHHPNLLFNIAQCHRQLEELERSVFYYRLFLSDWNKRSPDQAHPSAGEAARHIRELTAKLDRAKDEQACQAQLEAEQARRRQPCPAALPAADTEGGEQRQSPRWLRVASWTAVGVGGAGLVAGVVLSGLVQARVDDHEAAVAEQRPYRELLDIRGEVRSLEQAQIATLVSGASLLLMGGSFLVWDALFSQGGGGDRVTVLPVGIAHGLGLSAVAEF